MPKIKQLPLHEAQKIAAGQVVDRPAHAIKELLENALDAGATKISLYVEDGGKKLIRIIDNGCGMDKADAQACFLKHATSKISSFDELETVQTFGFRGEALASIAAVSKVDLVTKEQGSSDGLHVTAAQGNITIQAGASADGTSITVQELFYNVPARAKFLKKRETEWRQILQLVQAFCLDYPAIQFSLFSEGKQVLHCPPVKDFTYRFAQIWEHALAQHMVPIHATHGEHKITLQGAISNHQYMRYDRSQIFFFVNKRWVKNFQLCSALLKGYENVVPHGKYPAASISITIDPTLVDINIHPRKEEVAFANPRVIEQLIQKAVKRGLEEHLSKQIKKQVTLHQTDSANYAQKPFRHAEYSNSFTPFDFDKHLSQSITLDTSSVTHQEMPAASDQAYHTPVPPLEDTQVPITPAQDSEPLYTILGQYNKTYILIEQESGLFFVDQHAAQERILYEKFAQRFQDSAQVNLLFPQIITLSPYELTLLEPYLTILQDYGIGIETFGTDQLIIQSTPVYLKDCSFNELIAQTVSWIKDADHLDKKDLFKIISEKLRAQMACKAAVKEGDILASEQMKQLIDELYQTPNRHSCPHGRPTGWILNLHEIERKFRRRT